ncbi:beta-lactamase domain-containing protein 2-like [Saccoglossus kowalevskii]|uniref:Beta-lactamase domain-containing protein 2-like n=1 Tax=Saccoglossus kowalevskii TaxID=10224 RepID=A0ABM0GQ17_SACKO|nr:PREDICTED: beta-lactamase domain-containing protein 2-like [Saccoglossus kowalevskii]
MHLPSAGFILVCVFIALEVPYMLQTTYPVRTDGKVDKWFDEVARVFREIHEEGLDSGSAFAVYYKGNKVVDLWGGYENVETGKQWKQNTMSMTFSVTKAMVALCMAVAVDRGYADYNQRVAHYWPEFSQQGKGNITIKHVLNHEAGIPMTTERMTFDIAKDHSHLAHILETAKPMWPAGTSSGFHFLTYGWLVDQVIRRVDPMHRSLGQFFHQEIAQPFDIDFYIGVPVNLHQHVADLQSTNTFELFSLHPLLQSLWSRTWKSLRYEDMASQTIIKGGDITWTIYKMNGEEYRSLEIPAFNGIGSARSIAKLFNILVNGGQYEGKTLVSPKTLINLTTCGEETFDEIILDTAKWCNGMMSHPVLQEIPMNRLIGHSGFGGQGAYFDLDNDLSFAYTTTTLSPSGFGRDKRYVSLLRATYNSIEKLKSP